MSGAGGVFDLYGGKSQCSAGVSHRAGAVRAAIRHIAVNNLGDRIGDLDVELMDASAEPGKNPGLGERAHELVGMGADAHVTGTRGD